MIKPCGNQILIDNTTPSNVTKGGIILPESRATGLYAWGIVKAIGPKVKYVKVGDRVRYTKLLGWQLGEGQALVKEYICDCVEVEI